MKARKCQYLRAFPFLAHIHFSCYSGFAFADVMKLTMEDFDIIATGKFWCSIYRSKSDELEAMLMLEKAVMLIKHKDHPRSIANGTIFPPITNQTVNRYLKILAEIWNINLKLTFHVTCHTFAFVVALKNGVPIHIVKAMLGHIKITTTENYTDVDEFTLPLFSSS